MIHVKYKKYLFLAAGMISTNFYACNKFLEMSTPKTELVTPLVFSSNGTANAAILAIYAQMSNADGFSTVQLPLKTGLLSDEFTNYSTITFLNEYYTNNLSIVSDDLVLSFWQPYYNAIFQCNAIIEGLDASSRISEEVKKQIQGEAKFLRAYFHFYLAQLFGDIPIISSTDYRINTKSERNALNSVYDFIVYELIEAKGLLHVDYVGSDGVTKTGVRFRPNKSTASALLARTYLYTKQYELAENEASEIIMNPAFELEELNNTFLNSSLEAIWQIQRPTGFPTTEANMFFLTSSPASGMTKMVSLSETVLSLFTESDARFINWIGKINENGRDYFFPKKYKNPGSEDHSESSTIFRLAELFLIRAEARIFLNKTNLGLNDLNQVRERANLTSLGQTESNVILDLVGVERVRELFSEGHRWSDIKRTGAINAVMQEVAPSKGTNWVPTSALLPIPQIERDRNPNLTQNIGY